MTDPSGWFSLCVECGPNVKVDEDGCCAACGATATGHWLDSYRDEMLERIRASHHPEAHVPALRPEKK